MSTLVAVVVIGVASYLFRFGPLVGLTNVTLPAPVYRALTYAGPSAMIALAVGAVVDQHQTTHGWTSLGAVLALAAGGLLAMRKHSFLTSVASGLVLYGGWLAGTALIAT